MRSLRWPRLALLSATLLVVRHLSGEGAVKEPSPRPIAIENVAVIDATGRPVQPDSTVVIDAGRILKVGVGRSVEIPSGSEVIDGRGKFLIPGLWDMHMHLSLMTEHALPVLIANGVTGVCDMGGELDQIDGWRKQIEEGAVVGPRIIRAGPIVDGPRPEPGKFRLIVNGAEDARQAVRSLKGRGVDFIKVYHFLSRDAYFAIADEAKKLRLPFAGHIPNGIDPLDAADAGQRSAEHTTVLLQSLIARAAKGDRTQKQLTIDAIDALKGVRGADIYKAFVRNGTWHTPTIVLARSFLLRAEMAARPDPRRNYVAAEAKEHWEKHNPVPQNLSEEEMAERRQSFEAFIEIVGAMHRAGVSLLAGTDPPTRDVFPGFSLHDELALLVRAGLSPLQAIQAATLNAARCLGLADSVGTIEVGKFADLVLLDADPLVDISNTQKIAAVICRGKVIARPALQALLDGAEAAINQRE